MNVLRAVALTVLLPVLPGCGQQDHGDGRGTSASGSAAAAKDHIMEKRMEALKPPSPDSVLYMIYQRDGDGAVTYEVEGGAIVSYWYGHSFDLSGRRYFTGFSSSTEGESGPDAEAGLMEPGHVAIGQATFVQSGDETEPTWIKVDTDGYVGEFGSNDQPDDVDTSRKSQIHELQDGRMLLAVPTRRFVKGLANTSHALLLFDPDNVDELPFRRWGYLGTITGGSDNSASCEDGAVTPCVKNIGILSFGAAGEASLPNLKITLSGTTIGGPGQARELGPDDALNYTFDSATGLYRL